MLFELNMELVITIRIQVITEVARSNNSNNGTEKTGVPGLPPSLAIGGRSGPDLELYMRELARRASIRNHNWSRVERMPFD